MVRDSCDRWLKVDGSLKLSLRRLEASRSLLTTRMRLSTGCFGSRSPINGCKVEADGLMAVAEWVAAEGVAAEGVVAEGVVEGVVDDEIVGSSEASLKNYCNN